MATIIEINTRKARETPLYGAGTEEFIRFLNDRVGCGWWVGNRPLKHMSHRPRVTQRAYTALENEFLRLYGPIRLAQAR